ncbi:hypothetical protein BDA96_03G309500 [Sorghum bicolor]|uniref:Uncharacterized protein n=2 Tax=Sorghum bicolor TaxID=4558 RepID=A0A921RFF9_SORBI|nr:hypothetical protein BDA96_03G309500 [Sorghum bicolor]OQU87478.1 hypothetical protein SORBI_3003G286650 [Sorghum bicolor]
MLERLRPPIMPHALADRTLSLRSPMPQPPLPPSRTRAVVALTISTRHPRPSHAWTPMPPSPRPIMIGTQVSSAQLDALSCPRMECPAGSTLPPAQPSLLAPHSPRCLHDLPH